MRGADKVRADVSADGGSVPLVGGRYALCGTELIGLLLGGEARGNVGASAASLNLDKPSTCM